ncbi:polyphosphoinositide phosphatase-like [Tetranychus urticae]|uniref:SAC domain-containing protein n=1 Tax=Tetranychus urticae TaxID=32264 RepID=T1KK25_TETUR|nr:polyphosphoinositide phosphatase-like [Tetranychus urticae]
MIISGVQKIVLYETKARYFIVGSNNAGTTFRVIKIDRTEPKELVLVDDGVKYNKKEITELLARITNGNKKKTPQTPNRISAYGIFGFVRFLEGYYMILITKRRKIAQIGHHNIYKILDTSMLYIPNDIERNNPDESKYLKMFQNVDLSSNFYFSYSYDLTHTLQHNLLPLNYNHHFVQRADQTIWQGKLELEKGPSLNIEAIRTQPNWKFVWNEYLLSRVILHPDWLLYVIHGFVSQTDICVFGRPIYLTLIARRSKKFAGTRFLKRGANLAGDVANEVETEQIAFDASLSSLDVVKYTSFVQIRGSIPSHWSQDSFKVVPKPQITTDFVDPYFQTAGRHFNDLLQRYGSPVIVLNLVKKREKKPHESVLSKEIKEAIQYLNQFVPQKHAIIYIGLDMARINKSKDVNVMEKLSNIGYRMLKLTGIFQSKQSNNLPNPSYLSKLGGVAISTGQVVQTGIVRVNCVDCLDRTNTAQFALGKCALAYQLYVLGVLSTPTLEFDTDAIRMLEEIYEDHGDTLALQYGGSQLVHRIKTYRKIAPLSSHSRDIMQTLSRYYSNTFSDADKQDAINLFLGVFRPEPGLPYIWDLSTDYYLHNGEILVKTLFNQSLTPITQWWDDRIAQCLPRSSLEIFKGSPNNIFYDASIKDVDMMTDGFCEQYRPHELTILANYFLFEISHTERHFMPNCTVIKEHSPFFVRQRPGKRKSSLPTSNVLPPNPSVSGHVSTSSNSTDDEGDDDYSSDEDISLYGYKYSAPSVSSISSKSDSFDYFNRECFQVNYGALYKTPEPKDIDLYTKYVNDGIAAGEYGIKKSTLMETDSKSVFSLRFDGFSISSMKFDSKITQASPKSKFIYEEYVKQNVIGYSTPTPQTLNFYQEYVSTVTDKSCVYQFY